LLEATFRLTAPAVVRELVDVLGSATVATIGGVRSTRSIYQWLNGDREPDRLESLRLALQIVYTLRAAQESDKTIAAWFRGVNPRLDFRIPTEILATENDLQADSAVIAAARAFAGI
jgi:hypothetical protein